MEETVVYVPSPCIRWLETGAGGLKEQAKGKARDAKSSFADRRYGDTLLSTVSAAVGAGKAALAEIMTKRGEATEYRFERDYFELGGFFKSVTIPYADVTKIDSVSDSRHRYRLHTKQGQYTISPVAWIESGAVKAPIGWERNGIEVPFALLIEEMAARCGVGVD